MVLRVQEVYTLAKACYRLLEHAATSHIAWYYSPTPCLVPAYHICLWVSPGTLPYAPAMPCPVLAYSVSVYAAPPYGRVRIMLCDIRYRPVLAVPAYARAMQCPVLA
eukprot:898639-Rhodomonas_salina.1